MEIKVLTFWTIFLTKEEFYFCLCRDTLSLRDSQEKNECDKQWNFFSFFPSDEVFRDS